MEAWLECGETIFVVQNINLLAATSFPQVTVMTEDVAKHFSTVPHTQGGAAPDREPPQAKDGLVWKMTVTREDT